MIIFRILLLPVFLVAACIGFVPIFAYFNYKYGMTKESLKIAQNFWLTKPVLWLHSYIFLNGKQELQTW